MPFKNIHIIINPASGNEEPILSYLNKGLDTTGISWHAIVITRESDVKSIVKSLIGNTDLIAIYGGDGTVSEVAQTLIGESTPIAIIPGGTANIMAKELGIPIDSIAAIELLKSENPIIKKIDTGWVNDQPFLMRINLGIMADMVSHTHRELKDSFGQLAYGISTLETLTDARPIAYKMTIDGQEIKEAGVSLTVTNVGNIGIAGYSFLPDISTNDGFFDVIMLDDANLLSILRVAGSTLLQTESEVLKRWKCKEIHIELDNPETIICDDFELQAQNIHIKINPHSLNILVPAQGL